MAMIRPKQSSVFVEYDNGTATLTIPQPNGMPLSLVLTIEQAKTLERVLTHAGMWAGTGHTWQDWPE